MVSLYASMQIICNSCLHLVLARRQLPKYLNYQKERLALRGLNLQFEMKIRSKSSTTFRAPYYMIKIIPFKDTSRKTVEFLKERACFYRRHFHCVKYAKKQVKQVFSHL